MPKYLVQASYTTEGLKGVLKDGGSARRAAIEKLVQSLGGKLETLYFAFGDTDVYMIIDSADNTRVAAAALAAG
ncbi:MAG: GYD domain-containing protein, partial [Betaproteobacteria bacterium]|nr:GYD domain-containing protein [Betaproteobacteria bacterium]